MYQQQFNPYAANVAIVKGYFKSGKVLAVGILYIIYAILGILSVLVGTTLDPAYYEMFSALERMGVDPSVIALSYTSSVTSTVISTLVSSVITVLIAVSFIILFAKSRNTSPYASPITGVKILHVIAVIAFVCSIVLAALVAVAYLLLIAFGTAVSNYFGNGYAGAATVILVIAGVFFALLLFFLIFANAKYKTYYRSIKNSLTSVELQNKGATAWGVINIIMAVCSGISLLPSLANTLTAHITAYSLLSLFSLAVTFVISILEASIALGYSNYISRQRLGYNNTPYGGTPSNAYAPTPGNQPVYREQPPYQNPVPPQNAPAQNPPKSVYNDNFIEAPAPAQEGNSPLCPRCGAPINEPTLPFCGNCGSKILTK